MAESPGKMVALAIALSILAVVAVGLRFYARRIKGTEFAWDDYLIVPALVRSETKAAFCNDCLELGTDHFPLQAFTIATAVCMLVGKYPLQPRVPLHVLRRPQALPLGTLDGIAPLVQMDGLLSIVGHKSLSRYL